MTVTGDFLALCIAISFAVAVTEFSANVRLILYNGTAHAVLTAN